VKRRQTTRKVKNLPGISAASRAQPWFPAWLGAWSPAHSRAWLFVLTLLCLLPFVGKAFHIDDTLFLWTAKHIVETPLNPYGFSVVWYDSTMPLSEVMQNPPLAAYYAAAAGSVAGWSEYALHLAFFLPVLAVVLSVYRLAAELTTSPLLAAAATLVAPGFLVSSTSIMSDVPMLALWMIAIVLWRRGLDTGKPFYLAGSALLIAACALTKYYGACLLPLLLLYSLWKKKGVGIWLLYLLIPVALLAGYQQWTSSLYGRGLLSDAAAYARQNQLTPEHPMSFWGASAVGLSFVGGCTLPALIFIPWLWRRAFILGVCLAAALGATATAWNWIRIGIPFPAEQRGFLVLQLACFIAGGISVLALAVSDLWQRRDADSVFLAAWVLGTFVFAAYLNWVLPLIPAATILIARRLDTRRGNHPLPASRKRDGLDSPPRRPPWALIAPLALSGLLSLWVAWGDMTLANSAREAAYLIHDRNAGQPGKILFFGHWGFQYYMQSLGAQPLGLDHLDTVTSDDLIVQPENNANVPPMPVRLERSREVLTLPDRCWMATMCSDRAAGFYTAFWGVVPFALGSVTDERYTLVRLFPSAIPLSFHRPVANRP
jgi:4-amino-4-deoxy-L-arabinose transferase-like glycosyltransferase